MALSALSGCNILVVEDEYLIALDIRRNLTEAGAIVLGPVPSVGSALALLNDGTDVDAAILDVNLGTEPSFPVAERLEALAIPFLVATDYNSADVPPQWRHATIVIKPLPLTAFAKLLTADDAL